MDALVERSLQGRGNNRLMLFLSSAFALLTTALASAGIYGTVSYRVHQRRHEIGVRIALGAQAHHIVRAVLRDSLRPVAIGLPLGIGVAWTGGYVLDSLLFGITPTDALTYVTVAFVFLGISIVTSMIPALGAIRADPLIAIRED